MSINIGKKDNLFKEIKMNNSLSIFKMMIIQEEQVLLMYLN